MLFFFAVLGFLVNKVIWDLIIGRTSDSCLNVINALGGFPREHNEEAEIVTNCRQFKPILKSISIKCNGKITVGRKLNDLYNLVPEGLLSVK